MDAKAKISLLQMAALAAGSMPIGNRIDTRHYSPRKAKQGGPNPMRGYYARYSHLLTEYLTERNKSKFQGFRKVRVMIQPRRGPAISVWRKA